jgi:repressor LexA
LLDRVDEDFDESLEDHLTSIEPITFETPVQLAAERSKSRSTPAGGHRAPDHRARHAVVSARKSGLNCRPNGNSSFELDQMNDLTERQSAVLEFLRDFMAEHGHAPTEREIQSGMEFSSQSVSRHYLAALEKKGAVIRHAGKARGLVLPGALAVASRPMLAIPLLGSIPAGFPVEGEQQSGACIMVDADTLHLPRNARTFALQVRGDSMTGVAILDGDTVVMEFRDPKHGDIVAALIDGETTLKRYVIRKGRPWLRAENPKYADLIPARELVVQGVMVALLRVPREKKRA